MSREGSFGIDDHLGCSGDSYGVYWWWSLLTSRSPRLDETDLSRGADITEESHAEPGSEEASLRQRLQKIVSQNRSLRETALRLRQQNKYLEERHGELIDLVNHDPYTGLPIRRLFDRRLDERFQELSLQSEPRFMVLGVIRLDRNYSRIKNSRDRNKILIFKTTSRIKDVIGENLFQSDRLDEFHILLDHIPNMAAVELIADKITEGVARPHEAPADDISFGCYLGIAVYPVHGKTRDELLGNADIALNRCETLDTPYVIYTDEMGRQHREREMIEADLRLAADTGFEQFSIVYQPFVDREGRIIGSEALLRWKHPTLGDIPPQVFIPIAEQTGDIRVIGQWVLYNSCRQLSQWHKKGYVDLYVSVNLSPYQFKQRDLVGRVAGVLSGLGLKGRYLKLEFTESMLMENRDEVVRKMFELKAIGVRLSIDDFGTGYSSLNYLRKLPIDTVKIDKSFVDDVTKSEPNQQIIRAIISLVHAIHLECLAEGAENGEQVSLLLAEGCDAIQGYYFSKPVEPSQFLSYLDNNGRFDLPLESDDSDELCAIPQLASDSVAADT